MINPTLNVVCNRFRGYTIGSEVTEIRRNHPDIDWITIEVNYSCHIGDNYAGIISLNTYYPLDHLLRLHVGSV